jgi:heavy metal efflux system protein
MIEKIVKSSIRNKYTVIIATLIFTLVGLFNALKLSIDAVPDVTNVQVSAVTASPGLSPLEVEQFITFPIEMEFNGLPNLTEIRSISRTGVSSVTAVFKDGTDIYFARQLVNERLKQAERNIPPSYGTPELSPIATGLGDIYEFVLVSDRHTEMELRTYMDWEIAKQIKSVRGIIDVNVVGGEAKQYQILIDPLRLQAYNLTLSEIIEKLQKSNMNIGGGYISKKQEQIVIRGESQFKDIADIQNFSVKTSKDGVPLLLSQIGEVKQGSSLRFGLATKNGKGEVVSATCMMLMGENSLKVVKSVKAKIKEIQAKLPVGMRVEVYYDRSEFIGRTLKTVFINLGEAAVLVLICLFITLGTLKGALLVGLAIPVSMLITTIFMNYFGVVGNLMSLGALDFGLLVDGSIVMLESVLHGFVLKEKIFSEKKTMNDIEILSESVIIESCLKVARAATFSVGIIMLVYLPLMTLEGVEGRMFRPMSITVAIALGVALLYSLTTFPAMVAVAYQKPIFQHSHAWEVLTQKYKNVLLVGVKKKTLVITSSIGIFLLSLLLGSGLGSEFLPKIDEGELSLDIKRLPSVFINYSKKINLQMEKILLDIPEITGVVTRMGRGESAAEPIGPEEGESMIKLKPKSEWTSTDDREELIELIKTKLNDNVPSSTLSISQPIENRVNSLLSGSKSDVVIKIFGDDLYTLKDQGQKYYETLKKIRGVADIRVQKILGLPMMEILADRQKMARYGVDGDEILRTVEAMRVGAEAGKVFEGVKRFNLIVRLKADIKNIEVVENIPVMTNLGNTIPLSQVAEIRWSEGPAAVYHESLKRRIMVELNVRGRDMVGFVKEAQEKTKEIEESLPPGYSVDWGGQFENFTRAKERLSMVVPVSMVIIFAMLIGAFGNIYYALGVFMIVPLSTAGGILSLVFRGLPFSIPAGVGFIAAAGISVLNGVVYSSALKNILENGGDEDIPSAVIQAATSSLRAVSTTVMVAVIGFIPMALAGSAGAEIQRPLATVVIGGVIIATTLSQFLLPIVMEKFLIISKRQEDARETKERKQDEELGSLDKEV